ncbi:MAG: glycosyltransferase family 4 protein [Anaerolineae bacterium]|nr:glycosyltransferase family 4 protein [Anaerolineae bacterium]
MPKNYTHHRKLNILMLAPTMFFADYGAHVRILEEVRTLQKRGHRVTILAYPNGRDIDGLDVRRCWGVPFNYRVIVGSSRHKLYLDLLLALMALWHVIRYRPDIIHAHLHEGGLIGWVLSRLTGAPLVFDFQGSLTSEMIDHNFLKPNSVFHRFLYWLETRINHAADVILTSSGHAARLLIEQFRLPPPKVDPTPDCVNADTFSAANFSRTELQGLKQGLGIPAHKKVIAYLGVLTAYQGVDKLLESLKILRQTREDYHLLLMGYPAIAQYQALAQQLGVADLVTFTGKIPYDEAPRYLALGDIAVAPKLSATEGSGKILNYMALELPTVAFNLPVSREFLGDGGIYASEVSSQGLALALNRALDLSSDERLRLGRYLRHRIIQHYAWDRAIEQMEAVYLALLNGDPLPTTYNVRPATRPLSENL